VKNEDEAAVCCSTDHVGFKRRFDFAR